MLSDPTIVIKINILIIKVFHSLEDLIKFYKIFIDNVFFKSKNILSETIIIKLIKKAEKLSSENGKALLNGINYNEEQLEILNVLNNFKQNKTIYTAETITTEINSILHLLYKTLSMIAGKNESSKILKDALEESISNNSEIWNNIQLSTNIEDLLPEFVK
ncbi:MAG: hypothetical protein EAX96_14910 [Candidatus Lokiarchaeota archaeon]|nr:hypothetical protein [Candidatus Lokiarchaeota archaeon]